MWNGTGSAYEDDLKPGQLATVDPPKPKPVSREKRKPRYVVHMTSGRTIEAVSVTSVKDRYEVHGVTGGVSKYPQDMVASVEELPVESELRVTELADVPGTDGLPTAVVVTRVVDGDTIDIGGGTVRLIGIDTPETVHPSKPVEHFGREASAFAKVALEGQKVNLRYDPANVAIKHRDKYGRLLAYVHRHDGLDFNAEAIKQGFAHAYTQFPFARMEEFSLYEHEARENGRGLWEAIENPASSTPLPAANLSPTTSLPAPFKSQTDEKTHWISSSSGVRHNATCRYYRNSRGRECAAEEGRPCKICGG